MGAPISEKQRLAIMQNDREICFDNLVRLATTRDFLLKRGADR